MKLPGIVYLVACFPKNLVAVICCKDTAEYSGVDLTCGFLYACSVVRQGVTRMDGA